jgi:hypothetical protein
MNRPSGQPPGPQPKLNLRHVVLIDFIAAIVLSVTVPIMVHLGKSPLMYVLIPVSWVLVIVLTPLLLKAERTNRERDRIKDRGF